MTNYVYPDGSGVLCVGDGRLHITRAQLVRLVEAGVAFVTIDGEYPLPPGLEARKVEVIMDAVLGGKRQRRAPSSIKRRATRVTVIRVTTPDGRQDIQENMMEWVRSVFSENEIQRAYFALMRYGKYQSYVVEKLESKAVSYSNGEQHGNT